MVSILILLLLIILILLAPSLNISIPKPSTIQEKSPKKHPQRMNYKNNRNPKYIRNSLHTQSLINSIYKIQN